MGRIRLDIPTASSLSIGLYMHDAKPVTGIKGTKTAVWKFLHRAAFENEN